MCHTLLGDGFQRVNGGCQKLHRKGHSGHLQWEHLVGSQDWSTREAAWKWHNSQIGSWSYTPWMRTLARFAGARNGGDSKEINKDGSMALKCEG